MELDNKLLEKLLDLPEFKIDGMEHNEHDIRFYVSTHCKPVVCPCCGVHMPRLHTKQRRQQEVRDINILNKRVGLMVTRVKYRCTECNSLFFELLSSVPEKGRMTMRLRRYIAEQAKRRSFTEIAHELAISDVTIRQIFLEAAKEIYGPYEIDTPEVLGIDEIYVNREGTRRKKPYCVICNGEKNTVIEMLKDRNKPTIIEFFSSLQEPKKVRVVTMDMWPAYRDSVYSALPNAVVVIDKFHVVKMANKALDDYRKTLFKKFTNKKHLAKFKRNKPLFLMRTARLDLTGSIFKDAWLSEYPEFKVAYELKEELFDIYLATSREEAMNRYDKWLKAIPKSLTIYDDLITAFSNWGNEIFNYFDYPYTNAFVEGINSSIRAIEKQGRSYDFEVLRAKVIFSIGHKREMLKYGENIMFSLTPPFVKWIELCNPTPEQIISTYCSHLNISPYRDYGVPFESLINAIDEGLL